MSKKTKMATRPARRRSDSRVPKAGEMLAAHLRQRIISGEIKEGDRLPTERKLMEQFGVSRATFREAFRVLEAEGLVSVSRGARNGALVHRPTVRNASRQLNLIMQVNKVTLDDVYQSLAVFEPAVIRVLAAKATRADIEELRAEIEQMRQVIDDDAKYGELAGRFHRSLVGRVRLKSLGLVADLLSEVVGSYVASATASLPEAASRAAKLKAVRAKEHLVDLLEKHDAQGAEALWQKYFEITRKILLRWRPSTRLLDGAAT
jgi:GntR family transcriptional repressor for pyruvate dehydrogenase complex